MRPLNVARPITSRSGSSKGRERSSAWLIRLKIAVLAPMATLEHPDDGEREAGLLDQGTESDAPVAQQSHAGFDERQA